MHIPALYPAECEAALLEFFHVALDRPYVVLVDQIVILS